MSPVIPLPQPYTGGVNGRRHLLQTETSPTVDAAAVNNLAGTPPDLSQKPGVQVRILQTLVADRGDSAALASSLIFKDAMASCCRCA